MHKGVILLLAGQLPMLLFLDFGLGIQLSRDYGVMHVISFAVSMVFFGEMYGKALKQLKT